MKRPPAAAAAAHCPPLQVRGLPYRSSPAEILTFFQGYQYLPDSLQIGLDSLGRPSGEAWLTFINPQVGNWIWVVCFMHGSGLLLGWEEQVWKGGMADPHQPPGRHV